MRGLLAPLALFARRHYRPIFLVTFLVLALSALAVTRLRLDADVLNLLPRKDPVINTYLETLEEFGTFDYLMVIVPVPEEAPVDPYQAYLDRLAPRLLQLPQVESVEYRIEGLEQMISTFFPRSVLFLDEAGRQRFAERLSDRAIERQAAELHRRLSTPSALAVRQLLRLDPLGLAPVFVDQVAGGREGMAVDWTSGYFLSRDGRLLLMLVKPTEPPQDIDFDRGLLAAVEGAIAATDAEWGSFAGPGAPPAEPQVGGPHITALTDATLIQGDMVWNMATSMGLVLLLFLIAFRRIGPLAYAFIPLASGLLLTFAFASLTYGSVSSATSGTAALLIGLGIDFVIVSYGRFVEERQRGADLDEGLARMMGSSGRAVVVGAVTTAATFYAFTFTDFRGLSQMGVLTGTGILFCMAAVLLLLPAMLAWSEERHGRRSGRPNLYLHSFGTDRLVRFSLRRPRAVLAVGAVITVATGLLATRIGFQDSWEAMRPEGNPGVAVERAVAEHFESDFDHMMLVLTGPELGPLLDRTAVASERAQQLVDDGVMRGVTSISTLLPPPDRQRANLEWLADQRARGELDYRRIEQRFATALAAEGLRLEAFRPGLDLLRRALTVERPFSIEDMPREGQARFLVDRLLQRREDGWKSVVYLYPPADLWRRDAPPEAMALADGLAAELGPDAAGGVILTGANIVNANMRNRVRRDAWIAAVLGTVLVALLLWLDFRRLRAALLALTPLLVGIVWMLGAMRLAGLQMNFMNIFVTTMIIGIGVDYGLHMVHRYREVETAGGDLEGGDLEAGLVETGNAIVLAALSTIAGFGSLSLSHYPGLRSTGLVAILGAAATALVATTVLPAYMGWRSRRTRRTRRPR